MLLVLILFSSCSLAFPQKQVLEIPQYYIKIAQLNCDFKPEWIVNVSCKLKPTNWETTLANLSSDVIKPLRNLSANVQMFRRETRFVPFLVNITINACELIDNKGVTFYGRVLLYVMKKFSTLDTPTCPILGHIEVRNLYLEVNIIKVPLPVGVYKLLVAMTDGYPPQFVGLIEIICIMAEKRKRIK